MLDLHTAETESPIALQWSPNGGDWFFWGGNSDVAMVVALGASKCKNYRR